MSKDYQYVSIIGPAFVREYPRLSSKILYEVLPGMCCIVNDKESSDKNKRWVPVYYSSSTEEPISIGWMEAFNSFDILNYAVISASEAQIVFDDAREKRRRLASAITAMLIRSLTVQKAIRFARSLVSHATTNYPGKSLALKSNKSIEEIMIELGGFSSMSKQQVFEFIKVAACNQV